MANEILEWVFERLKRKTSLACMPMSLQPQTISTTMCRQIHDNLIHKNERKEEKKLLHCCCKKRERERRRYHRGFGTLLGGGSEDLETC